METGSEVDHTLQTIQSLGHLGDLVLDKVELGQVQAKLLPRVTMLYGVVQQRSTKTQISYFSLIFDVHT